ncbi:hypothetical protein V565_285140 [Rhizoctonia solani 123E]|uniref:F-box domain-containing protein n=1 Tax=Rhizoctonia solani 123E TaxID=1423351 RepID=A0A074RIZ5_9AGAM|nr:hypothetical protein V565_285140 [Rhizoctonia solani 123E]
MSTRSSARLAKQKAKVVVDADEKSEDDARDTSFDRGDSESEPEQAPPQKRRRAAVNPEKAAVGKKVRGQQGCLAGLINMPIDIFVEIASHLMPIDILALSRSNKSFRNLLMNRSSLHIWHAVMKNVPGLPPCPAGLSEPSYLSLLFSKTCSMCGKAARVGPDKLLLVRLCASCRQANMRLIMINSDAVRLKLKSVAIAPGNRRVGNGYVLRDDLAQIQTEHQRMTRSGGKSALESWEKERKQAIAQRKQASQVLSNILGSYQRDEEQIAKDASNVRRSEIERRLGELGWTKEDIPFYWRSTHYRAYTALVNQPKPLTERSHFTTNIKPKLIPILEANRAENLMAQRLKRKKQRQDRLSELFLEIMDQTTPTLEFQIQLPDPLVPNEGPATTVTFDPPFPSLTCLLNWPLLKNLLEIEATVEEMETRFEDNRTQIQDYIANWITSVQTQFADQLRQDPGLRGEILQPTAVITDNGDPFSNLSDELKLLLRADSLFCLNSGSLYDCPKTYSSILINNGLTGPMSSLSCWEYLGSPPNLNKLVLYPEARAVARMLLLNMGRPNASYIEMNAVRSSFGCGRCYEADMNWEKLVHHYIRHKKLYSDIQEGLSQLAIECITYNDTHNPDVQPDRPLVRYQSVQAGGALFAHPTGRLEICKLCDKIRVIRGKVALSKPEMMQHLLDVHSIIQPKVNEHYHGVTQKLAGFWGSDAYGFPIF